MEQAKNTSQNFSLGTGPNLKSSKSVWRDVIRTYERVHYAGTCKIFCRSCYKYALTYPERIVLSMIVLRVMSDFINSHSAFYCSNCKKIISFKQCKIDQKIKNTGEYSLKTKGRMIEVLSKGLEHYALSFPHDMTVNTIEGHNRLQCEYAVRTVGLTAPGFSGVIRENGTRPDTQGQASSLETANQNVKQPCVDQTVATGIATNVAFSNSKTIIPHIHVNYAQSHNYVNQSPFVTENSWSYVDTNKGPQLCFTPRNHTLFDNSHNPKRPTFSMDFDKRKQAVTLTNNNSSLNSAIDSKNANVVQKEVVTEPESSLNHPYFKTLLVKKPDIVNLTTALDAPRVASYEIKKHPLIPKMLNPYAGKSSSSNNKVPLDLSVKLEQVIQQKLPESDEKFEKPKNNKSKPRSKN